MKRATVVIGACYGDEGKGLMVDYYARQQDRPMVIRYNGGAQAGHTVVTPDKRRHVFHHFGAGAFTRAFTYLSRFFVVNPILWGEELMHLGDLIDPVPLTVVDKRALLTTPYDMLINQELERSRGDERHGSCGVGINETITRCEFGPHTTAALLQDLNTLRGALEAIRIQWVPVRLSKMGVKELSPHATKFLYEDGAKNDALFMKACSEMHRAVLLSDKEPTPLAPLIFEGAQGLLLDEEHEFFPHVTRSKTGLRNVCKIAQAMGITGLDVTYVMRAYMTRHGAGPFPTEDPAMLYVDDTNVSHAFQGNLRFGHLDIHNIDKAIKRDLWEANGLDVKMNLAVTHLDQIERGEENVIIPDLDWAIRPHDILGSYGPTRDDVVVLSGGANTSISGGNGDGGGGDKGLLGDGRGAGEVPQRARS